MSELAIEYLKEIKEILQKQNEPKMLFVKDVARILGINQNKANELWNRDDFPGIHIGQKKIEQKAFDRWLQSERK
jgi:hypothetical protein